MICLEDRGSITHSQAFHSEDVVDVCQPSTESPSVEQILPSAMTKTARSNSAASSATENLQKFRAPSSTCDDVEWTLLNAEKNDKALKAVLQANQKKEQKSQNPMPAPMFGSEGRAIQHKPHSKYSVPSQAKEKHPELNTPTPAAPARQMISDKDDPRTFSLMISSPAKSVKSSKANRNCPKPITVEIVSKKEAPGPMHSQSQNRSQKKPVSVSVERLVTEQSGILKNRGNLELRQLRLLKRWRTYLRWNERDIMERQIMWNYYDIWYPKGTLYEAKNERTAINVKNISAKKSDTGEKIGQR